VGSVPSRLEGEFTMSRSLFAVACCVLIALPVAVNAGTLVNLKNQAPEGIDVSFQLTDGRVLGQSFNEQHWYILTPDNKGSYVNGTWTRAADLPSGYAPYAFSSAVLPDESRRGVRSTEKQMDETASAISLHRRFRRGRARGRPLFRGPETD
jgi:hypothetical protein